MLRPTRRTANLTFLLSFFGLALPPRARADHDANILSGPFGRGEVPHEVDFGGNSYSALDFQGTRYTIAEISSPGRPIGKGVLVLADSSFSIARNVTYIQSPSSAILNYNTKEPLECCAYE